MLPFLLLITVICKKDDNQLSDPSSQIIINILIPALFYSFYIYKSLERLLILNIN